MPNPGRLLLIALLLLAGFPVPSFAEPAETVRGGVGFAIAPHVLRGEDAGLEVDILREAFRANGVCQKILQRYERTEYGGAE